MIYQTVIIALGGEQKHALIEYSSGSVKKETESIRNLFNEQTVSMAIEVMGQTGWLFNACYPITGRVMGYVFQRESERR